MNFLPVTSVKLIQNTNLVLAGSANELSLFCFSDKTKYDHILFNEIKTIHGIKLSGDTIIVYGGFVFHVTSLVDKKFHARKLVGRHNDFILDCLIYKDDLNIISFCVSLAHGSSHFYTICKSTNTLIYNGISRPIEQTLLYCCHLFDVGDSSPKLCLAGGSVENTIMIWEQSFQVNADCQAVAVLKGHKGAIFSISVNTENALMVSVGDDRTVMLWQTNRLSSDNGDSVIDVRQWRIVRSMFGHESRVWGGVSVRGGAEVVTWGEDCSVRVWAADSGAMRSCVTPHQGRSVWCGDFIANDDCILVVTGGNDGAVIVSEVPRHSQAAVEHSLELPHCGDFPRQILFLNDDVVMVISSQGRLSVLGNEVTTLPSDISQADLEEYSFAVVHSRLPVVILGNGRGSVFVADICRESSLRLDTRQRLEMGHKVMLIAAAEEDGLFVSLSNGHVVLLDYEDGLFHLNTTSFSIGRSPATCGCSWTDDDGRKNVMCGDKSGVVSLFTVSLPTTGTTVAASSTKRLGTSKCGITAITRDPRNGAVYVGNKIGEVYLIDERLSVRVVLKETGLLSWAARLEVNADGRLAVLGFKSVLFRRVIVDGENRSMAEEHACGGGHRGWDYRAGALAFIQSKSAKVARWPVVAKEPLVVKPSLHGKEINCCLLMALNKAQEGVIIANGSEDRTISTLTYTISNDSKLQLKGIQRLHSHISSVRCVVQMVLGGEETVLVTGGGRGQIVVWEVSDVGGLKALSSVFLQRLLARGSEARIMDLAALPSIGQDSGPLLAVACSSGYIALLSTNAKDHRLRLHLHHKVSASCLTCISTVQSGLLITCSTDGHLYTIPVLSDSLALGVPQCHFVAKSSLHGLDAHVCDDGTVLMSLGGDDGGVRVMSIGSCGLVSKVTAKVEHLLSHAGSTVCTKWLHGNMLASLGSDEVLLLWRVTRTDGGLSLDLVKVVSACVGVTDPHSIVVFRLGSSREYVFYVAGMGARVLSCFVDENQGQ